MKTTHRWILVSAAVLCLIAWTLAYGKDDTELKGMIVERTADTMTVRSADGTTTVVLLSDDTKVQTPKGLGLRHREESWTSLIPGLPVTVKGDPTANGQLAARQIRFTNENLKTASMIQAGLTPTSKEVQENQQNIATNKEDIASNQQQIATNQQAVEQRFTDLADYDTTSTGKVFFGPGSSTLDPKDKDTLSRLVATASSGAPGYLIQVKGFADSTGNAAMNQKLSRDRAEAVIEYLMQTGNIPPRHIVAPGAMGISDPVASNESAQGRAENRRVEVKVLVNKGLAAVGAK
jgi:outer membrane protein OmpA-like peptidoglycan-associated protein